MSTKEKVPESSVAHSVLLPAPVPSVNPWTSRKTSAAAAIANHIAKETKKVAPRSDLPNKENSEQKDGKPPARQKFQKSEKWTPSGDSESEAGKPKKNKTKKKKSKTVKDKKDDKKIDAKEEQRDVKAFTDLKEKPQNSSETVNKEVANPADGKVAVAESAEPKEVKLVAATTGASSTSSLNSAAADSAVAPANTPTPTNALNSISIAESSATPSVSPSAYQKNEVSDSMSKINIKDSEPEYAHDESEISSQMSYSSENQKSGNYRNNHYKNKNGYKQRNHNHEGSPYLNNGYNKYNGGHKSHQFRNNTYSPVNSYGYVNNPYFAQPYMNPMYGANGGMAYNPIYFQSPVPVQFNGQFEPSPTKFGDGDSNESSAPPSRRSSSVGSQAPVPKFVANQPPQFMFNSPMMMPGNTVGQPPFLPQFSQMMPPMMNMPFMPQSPMVDPRLPSLVKQITYYFSLENLEKDSYLKGLMDPSTGGVKLHSILNFKKVKIFVYRHIIETFTEEELEEGSNLLRLAINSIPTLELIDNGEQVRLRDDWQKWVNNSS